MKIRIIVFSCFLTVLLISCISIQDKSLSPQDRASAKIIGRIDVTFTTYQFFHIYSKDNVSKKAYSKLIEKAKKMYQGNIDVVNINAEGTYNALSLLIPLPIYGAILSNFQTIRAYGDVILLDQNSQTIFNKPNMAGIDGAIVKASNDLIKDLQAKNTIAVINISSNDNEISAYVLDTLEFQLVSSRKFTIVDRKTLDSVRSEQNFQMSGSVSDSSAVSIGNMLGANIVITGSITRTGTNQQLTLKALDVKTAQIITMVREAF
jgi:hypothetical protein